MRLFGRVGRDVCTQQHDICAGYNACLVLDFGVSRGYVYIDRIVALRMDGAAETERNTVSNFLSVDRLGNMSQSN